ncbi:MAG: hypothetical protein E7070_04415 [Bacteroidales bacterium]|jgi:hypothetical protein|nr:hypothetical protein [Bacteroidales bacterium]
MKVSQKKLATRKDWIRRNQLLSNPDVMMEDPYGNPAESWQLALARQLNDLRDFHVWKPMVVRGENGNFGVWDQFRERELLPCAYDDIGELPEMRSFDDNFSAPIPVKQGTRWGVVSSDGLNNVLLPFDYDAITTIEVGFLLLQAHLWGLYRPSNGILFPCVANEIWLDETLAIIIYRKNHKLGVVYPYTDAVFDSIRQGETDREICFSKDGVDGYLTKKGNFIPKKDYSKYPKRIFIDTWTYPYY